MRWKQQGHWYLAIGAVHTITGVALGWNELAGIARDGFFNTVPTYSVRDELFWFLVAGLVIMLVGATCNWIERAAQREPPAFVAWSLLALSVIGVVLMPASGFWLLLAASAVPLVRGMKQVWRSVGAVQGANPDSSLIPLSPDGGAGADQR